MNPLSNKAKLMTSYAILVLILVILLFVFLSKEQEELGKNLLPFGYQEMNGYSIVKDLKGRKLALVPKTKEIPKEVTNNFPPERIIRTPPEKVVITSWTFDSGILSSLGLENSIVGTAETQNSAVHPQILDLWQKGAIGFVGLHTALDFEKIKHLDPDLILTASFDNLGDLEYMDFPVVGTYDSKHNSIQTRLDLITFIGTLYGEREKALKHVKMIREVLDGIKENTKNRKNPKVSWGIYDSGHVFGIRSDFWLSELIKNAGGIYLMEDYVSNSTEISLEYFITHSKDADIFFANIYEESGVKNKGDMLIHHEDLRLFKAFTKEGIVITTKEITWQDTGNLHEIAIDIASILHPELYPDRKLTYFKLLED
jgi:ABC-type Fe3+-hydroxamate transport system substrate-binding protein